MNKQNVLDFEIEYSPYKETEQSEFLNHLWQDKSSVTNFDQFQQLTSDILAPSVLADMKQGLDEVGMSIRINPYIMELIDWANFETDPIRRQFLPLHSELEEDHPCLSIDSLGERATSPVQNLVHRYPDKVLFLVTSVCPVYCQFCTRSYAVGQDTAAVKKDNVTSPKGWDAAIDYIRANPQIEDIVVSGGDIARLKPAMIKRIGTELLDIEHIRRIRFATKALSVQPMKFLTDDKWFSAIADIARYGRSLFKSVYVHSHFNHPREVTPLVEMAMRRLFAEGVYVRNQTVLLRGVNDTAEEQIELIRKLGRINIQPYYVYACDMVKAVEHFRVPVSRMQELEQQVRGATAGFNTPLYVVDAPGGGGKRDVHSHSYSNESFGVYGYRSPMIDADRTYLYFDPLSSLDQAARDAWNAPDGKREVLRELGFYKPNAA